jgi:ceramide glucosyltransferase
MLTTILEVLLVASWLFWLLAWWWVRAFLRRPASDSAFQPSVSILKPARGLDADAYRNFLSFCQQDYPDFELIFGVADATDPAVAVVKRLQRDCPTRSIRLVVAPTKRTNRKAGLLHVMSAHARHGILVVSDSDMRVTPDYLRRVVAPLADPSIGLVTCLFRGRQAVTFTARLEALYWGATFLPLVVVARRVLRMRFALGSTLALRREDLLRLGGFAAVAEYLVDDYQVGARIADLGLKVYLSDYIVENVLGPTTFRAQWDREVRWAHCHRVSRPREYPGLLLTFSTPLAVVLVIWTHASPQALLALVASLLLRWTLAWLITGETRDRTARRWMVWLPLRDLLSALIWCMGAGGRQVVWRGETFALSHDGRLVPLPSEEPATPGATPALRPLVRGLDACLRRTCHIFEFSPGQDCLFRLALGESRQDLTLSDGTPVRRGDLVGELHLWNEHIPPLGDRRSDLAWALAFRRQLIRSLRELTAYTQTDPRLARVKAFRGEGAFGSRYTPVHLAKMAERWGFELVRRDGATGWRRRFADFWENLHATCLTWAYNPASLRGRRVWELRRDQFWITRETLLRRYGAEQVPSEASRKVPRSSPSRVQPGLAESQPHPAPQGL